LLQSQVVTRNLQSPAGFTFVDVVVAVSIFAILAAIAVPTIQNMGDAIALGQSQRIVQSELQRARLKAVTSNRVMRVRFNCPAAQQFRVVELIGTPTVPAAQDTAANRCSETVYPFPAADNNPVTMPNNDGPVRRIDRRVTFGATQTIEFRPTGIAYAVNADGTSGAPLAGNGVSITLTKGTASKAVTVNALGKITNQ
jgi:Tfp pilus assembly protein FimT